MVVLSKTKRSGVKKPFRLEEIWRIRTRLEIENSLMQLALLNLAIDSKLRGCDLVKIRIRDISSGGSINNRAMVMQQKTHQPVQFEITEQTRLSIQNWISKSNLKFESYLVPNRCRPTTHISTRPYARLVKNWVKIIGLDPSIYGTHSMRRTKATLIYKQTKNLRAVQLLLGHTKLESTVRYLGVEVDDALEMSESIEI